MPKPAPADVWKAIEIYLRVAYAGAPPAGVRGRLETLRHVPDSEFYHSGVIERQGDPATRFALRLGNRHYPHMKLVIERRPDGNGYLFRADTHDKHCCPEPQSQEYPMFCRLMESNKQVAHEIESAWAQEDVPTFKGYLRADLERRREQA